MHLSETNHPAIIVYPDNDGKPMAENTKQFRWITTLKGLAREERSSDR